MTEEYAKVACDPEELAVLILAPTGRDALLSGEVLEHAGIRRIVCQSISDLLSCVEAGAGPAVVAVEALRPGDMRRLEAILEVQPRWSDLPLVLLAQPRTPLHQMEHLSGRRHTTVLRRPIQVPTFLTVIRTAVEARRRQYEVRNLLQHMNSLNERLEQRTTQLERLALELTRAEESERQRLGQMLHDDLQQLLVGAKFHLSTFPNRVRQGDPIDPSVAQLQSLLDQAVNLSRSMSHELSPPVLQVDGLSPALEWLARQMLQNHGLQVALSLQPQTEPRDPSLSLFLFRSIQELLFNIVKHAGVKEASVTQDGDGDWTRIIVSDAGKGFDLESWEDAHESPGFGLFSIRERCELLGGILQINTAPGQGSRFILLVPSHAGDAGDGDHSNGSKKDGDGDGGTARLRVVLVDDHKVMREGLGALLNDEPGIEVVAEAEDGREALRVIAMSRPDLVVMDVAMPGMDGVEATRQIKALHPDIRIIGLSMFGREEMAQRMLEAGAEAYLSKAGESDDLIAAVRGAKA